MEQRGKTYEVGVHHEDGIWRKMQPEGVGSKSVAEVSLERFVLAEREQKA